MHLNLSLPLRGSTWHWVTNCKLSAFAQNNKSLPIKHPQPSQPASQRDSFHGEAFLNKHKKLFAKVLRFLACFLLLYGLPGLGVCPVPGPGRDVGLKSFFVVQKKVYFWTVFFFSLLQGFREAQFHIMVGFRSGMCFAIERLPVRYALCGKSLKQN